MRTSTNPEEKLSEVLGSASEAIDNSRSALLEAGLRRDQQWRVRRRKSLQAELQALERAPQRAAVRVFALIFVAVLGWMLFNVANGHAELTAANWMGLLLTPLTLASIPAMLTRVLVTGVCQGLRRIILRRAKNDHVEP